MYALVYVDTRNRPGHSLRKKNKVAQNEKWKKKLWIYIYMTYSKFGSISVGHFIKHIPLIPEEWTNTRIRYLKLDFCFVWGVWARYTSYQVYKQVTR